MKGARAVPMGTDKLYCTIGFVTIRLDAMFMNLSA